MKRFLTILAAIVLFASCKQEELDKSDALSSGRGFIEASLKGDFPKAEKFMLRDTTNEQYLAGYKEFTTGLDALEREYYRDADIIVDSTKTPDENTTIIFYKNSYKKEPAKLKVIKVGDEWLVDFKYSFVEDQE
ncbi:MAG: hypothetical protein J5I50_11825 [Chitinophagaceae bacterium]|nr:hypothetical protein [Chitinophagaceae bacterium]